MSTSAKGIILLVGAYMVTMAVAVLMIVLAISMLIDTHNCSAIGRAMLILWGATAAVFLTSIIVVGVAAWKIISELTGRVAVIALYGIAVLVSYIIIAFGLLVAFNC